MVGLGRHDAPHDKIVARANRLQPPGLRLVSSRLLGTLARAGTQLCSLAAGVALALTAIAASAQPSDTPTVPPPTPAQQPVSKSDDHRIVGKVLELDQEAGRVKLATEEGVITLEVPEQTARAFRVGDTVSVSRSSIKSPSASPRQ
jgi:hypothetical protein